MQFQPISAIKLSLKTVLMQARLEQLESTLSQLEKHVGELEIKESNSQLQNLLRDLKKVFLSEESISESDKEAPHTINSRIITLCNGLAELKEQKKRELSTIVKNKKKVGMYNQLK